MMDVIEENRPLGGVTETVVSNSFYAWGSLVGA